MFAEILKELCNKKGINFTKLAQNIGCSAATATGWKRGSVPKYETLIKIAEYFGVSVKYLQGEFGQMSKTAPQPSKDREIGRLEGRIEELNKQIENIETKNQELQSKVWELEKELEEIKSVVDMDAVDDAIESKIDKQREYERERGIEYDLHNRR